MRSALRAHSGMVELAMAIGLYAMYEVVRGFGSTTLSAARLHTDEIVALERHLGVFVERAVQQAVEHVPAAPIVRGAAAPAARARARGGRGPPRAARPPAAPRLRGRAGSGVLWVLLKK